MNGAETKGKVIEGAITGVAAAVLGFTTDHLLIWGTGLSVMQTVLLGFGTATGAAAGTLEIMHRRRLRVGADVTTPVLNSGPDSKSPPQDGSDPRVRFWHCIADRERHGQDVRALLKAAQRRAIITGIELHYVIKYCAQELKAALSSGTLVGIVISKATPRAISFYSRYSRDVDKTISTTHEMYTTFADSLNAKQRECFALYHTDMPLTHSIGLYDDSIYVSEFCIDCASSVVPSFSPPVGSATHRLFIDELKLLLKEAPCKHGNGHSRLLGSL